MRIDNLKPGTKLMWDPKANYPGTDIPIIYPATVGEKSNGAFKSVMVVTGSVKNWMGPEQGSLRLPTEEELIHLTWPKL